MDQTCPAFCITLYSYRSEEWEAKKTSSNLFGGSFLCRELLYASNVAILSLERPCSLQIMGIDIKVVREQNPLLLDWSDIFV